MKFASPFKSVMLLLLATALTACGGGGSDGGATTAPKINATATPTAATIGINSATDITVRVTQQSGAPVADGTPVTASVASGSGNIASFTGGNNATTVGGNARFRFQSAATAGPATITFNAGSGTLTTTASTTVTVAGPSTGDSRLTLQAVSTSLPINAFNADPFLGSPYMTEVVITARSVTGQLQSLENGVQVSLNPIGATGGFTTLDDPETDDENEFFIRLGQGPVDLEAGKATIFVHSLNFSGQTTLTVTYLDPETEQTVVSTLVFDISTVTPPLPSSITLSPVGQPIYVQGSGGNTSGQIEIFVADGIGQPVPNPVSGNNAFNNVRLEIVGEDNGERLSGVNAAGQPVSGRSIVVRTTGGVAGAIFTAGTRTGNFVVRATADRADNNVDNGISDPVTADRIMIVSDGRLFSIEITSPFQNAITVNPLPVDPEVEPEPGSLPNDPDGTYSLTVAIIATDRQGNPVLPGTPIRFGLIDEPQLLDIGDFLISGDDGNPQEGGTLFTAPTGQFTTAGGGAGPGDTLVLFGKEVIGNRDHESARVVASVTNATSLTVQRRFNFNDDTGVSVNSGNVLPYVIGRAVVGNIAANAFTDANGVARTQMNYPVSAVGKRVIVWAQGDGDIVNGTPESVADVDLLAYPGIAALIITASPSSIPANGTYDVLVCLTDAFDAPIRSTFIGFAFRELDGNGSVDGVAGGGTVADPTGADGCTVASVTTSGVSQDGGELDFFVPGVEEVATVEIVRGELVLQARPSVITTTSQLVTLTLLNSSGQPQSGYAIDGECTGENDTIIALSNGPGTTNANGQTTVQVTSTNLNQIGQAGGGECTFRTVDGSAETTVEIIGRDLCLTEFSPPPEGCEDDAEDFTVTLTLIDANPAGNTQFTVGSSPAGLVCSVPDGGTQECTGDFEEGTNVILATTPSNSGPEVHWTGSCAPQDGANPDNVALLNVTGDIDCTATRQP